jgi:hypothetical protein
MHPRTLLGKLRASSPPEASKVIGREDEDEFAAAAGGLLAGRSRRVPVEHLAELFREPPLEVFPRICRTDLAEGCYRLTFTPTSDSPFAAVSLFATRFRGTLRVERVDGGYRISGDLYRFSLLDDLVINRRAPIGRLRGRAAFGDATADAATDDGDSTIPIYDRQDYHSYLEGTSAATLSFGSCRVSLEFDEWTYNHPVTGFNGTFDASPARSVRYALQPTDTEGVLTGDAFEGSTKIGTVSIRHVSTFVRRATLQVDTLEGAETPPESVPAPPLVATLGDLVARSGDELPAIVGRIPIEVLAFSQSFRTIFAGVRWDLTVNFTNGTIPLPPALEDVDPAVCTTWNSGPGDTQGRENLHDLMESVAGYDPDDLDTVWRAHLVAVPAAMGCGRGIVFDFGLIDGVEREGAATFSHDGYPAGSTCSGLDSAFGDAAGDRQFEHPRAFLRSAAHEVGHTFNQIHQSSEGGIDNSIMTTTNCVGAVIGQDGGTFPDDIVLGFNETVRRHLMHMPDPAVRPGGMDFGAAFGTPEPADVNLPSQVTLDVRPDSDRVRLGEPLPITWTLRNDGDSAVPVPGRVDTESMTARVAVTDPRGRTTLMRPVTIDPCVAVDLTDLAPEGEVTGELLVFYGRDGFAFEEPGRHSIDVIVLWELAGAHVAAHGSAEVFVMYPLTDRDNQVAAIMLDDEVGRAVAAGSARRSEAARERLKRVEALQSSHPATRQIKRLGLV